MGILIWHERGMVQINSFFQDTFLLSTQSLVIWLNKSCFFSQKCFLVTLKIFFSKQKKGIFAGLMNFLGLKMRSLQYKKNQNKQTTHKAWQELVLRWVSGVFLMALPVSGFLFGLFVGWLVFFSLERVVLFLSFWIRLEEAFLLYGGRACCLEGFCC